MRILLADDQASVRSALRLLLEQEPGMRVVSEAPDARSLLTEAKAVQPDLILLDWELPGSPITELLSTLRLCCAGAKVIALSGRSEARPAAAEARADAFISKGDPPDQVLATVQRIADGVI